MKLLRFTGLFALALVSEIVQAEYHFDIKTYLAKQKVSRMHACMHKGLGATSNPSYPKYTGNHLIYYSDMNSEWGGYSEGLAYFCNALREDVTADSVEEQEKLLPEGQLKAVMHEWSRFKHCKDLEGKTSKAADKIRENRRRLFAAIDKVTVLKSDDTTWHDKDGSEYAYEIARLSQRALYLKNPILHRLQRLPDNLAHALSQRHLLPAGLNSEHEYSCEACITEKFKTDSLGQSVKKHDK